MNKFSFTIVMISLFLTISFSATAQRDFSKVEIKTEKINDHIYVLFGQGGNVGVFLGKEKVLMIDDQFAPLSEKLTAAIKELSDQPIEQLVNTHWHGDHTGGNENFGKMGVQIIAHDNVYERMSTKQNRGPGRTVEPSPNVALPKITFNDKMSLRIDEEQIMLIHVDNAHTDGDAWVYFVQSNVLHMGDTYFKGRFPFIDLSSGGSAKGCLDAANRALFLINEETIIIPGHGQLSNKQELTAYRDMLKTIIGRVEEAMSNGKNIENINHEVMTEGFEDYDGGFISGERLVTFIVRSLEAEKDTSKQ
ncbi:MAG: MBL fold metallo-hydrolase [Bacteroidota bacterium]